MPIRVRSRTRLWPLPIYLNATASGLSWSAKVGPWSWNSRARRHRIDLPGALSWEQPSRGRRRKGSPARRRTPHPPASSGRAPWLLAAISAGCTIAVLLGAPLAVLLGGVGAGGAGAVIGWRRWRRAQDARVAQPRTLTADQRRRAQAPRHEPTCTARSIRTCRCPGMAAERAAAAKRAADARARKNSKSKGSKP